jgi:hypothetical protein
MTKRPSPQEIASLVKVASWDLLKPDIPKEDKRRLQELGLVEQGVHGLALTSEGWKVYRQQVKSQSSRLP